MADGPTPKKQWGDSDSDVESPPAPQSGEPLPADEPESADVFPLYVGNLDPRTTEEDIRSLVGSRGVIAVRLIKNSQTGEPKGFAYVDFSDESSYRSALQLDKSKLHGKELKINEGSKKEGGRERGQRREGGGAGGRKGEGPRGRENRTNHSRVSSSSSTSSSSSSSAIARQDLTRFSAGVSQDCRNFTGTPSRREPARGERESGGSYSSVDRGLPPETPSRRVSERETDTPRRSERESGDFRDSRGDLTRDFRELRGETNRSDARSDDSYRSERGSLSGGSSSSRHRNNERVVIHDERNGPRLSRTSSDGRSSEGRGPLRISPVSSQGSLSEGHPFDEKKHEERKRLQLLPRTFSQDAPSTPSQSRLFGGARPREENLAARKEPERVVKKEEGDGTTQPPSETSTPKSEPATPPPSVAIDEPVSSPLACDPLPSPVSEAPVRKFSGRGASSSNRGARLVKRPEELKKETVPEVTPDANRGRAKNWGRGGAQVGKGETRESKDKEVDKDGKKANVYEQLGEEN